MRAVYSEVSVPHFSIVNKTHWRVHFPNLWLRLQIKLHYRMLDISYLMVVYIYAVICLIISWMVALLLHLFIHFIPFHSICPPFGLMSSHCGLTMGPQARHPWVHIHNLALPTATLLVQPQIMWFHARF